MKYPNISASIVAFICLGLTSSLALAEKPTPKYFGKGNPFTVEELPTGKLKAKLQTLDPQARGKAMEWLHSFSFPDFDAQHHLRVDDKGGIFYTCPDGQHNCDGHNHGPVKEGARPNESPVAETTTEQVEEGNPSLTETPTVESAAVPISSPPVYNSKPTATRHIYLDFNGALVSGKAWTETDGVTTWNSWDCAAWSTDADALTFSDSEQAEMRRVYERIAEDYAPFDINVTTDVAFDPVTYTGNKNNVGWLLFTNTTDKNAARCPHYGSGGVAYVGVFGNSNFFSTYQPAWVTPTGSANMAEAASHEMGHNMGLSHDGLTSGAAYYGGHVATASAPSWGPIMGTGYGRNVSQWSKGDYYLANQLQDDLALISGKVPYRTDDHGDTFGAASVWLDSAINQSGVIERTDNPDYFAFTTGAGTINFNASTYRCDSGTWGANVDLILELYNSSQTLIASSNPAAEVTASISQSVAAGDYYLVVKPSAAATPLVASPSGYSSYGSVGTYKITGSIIPSNGLILTSPNGGENWMQGSTQNITWASGMGGNIKIELFKNGVLSSTIAASTANDGSHSWTIPSNQVLGTNYRVRITSLLDGSKVDESVADFSVTLPPIYFASMDTNPGWTLGTGWGFGQPTGTGQDAYGNPDPTTGYSGSNVLGYRLDGDYEGSITAVRWATTPVINCSNYQNIKLNFWRWLGVEGGYDNAYIEVSNNGSTWTKIWENSNTNGVNDDDGNWVNMQYDISAVANNQATVFIRWGMGTTDGSWNFCGWNLDDVKVTGDPMVAVGVVVTQSGGSTNVTEGGATDTYTVKLGSQPTANVTVNITPNSQVSVSPTSLTFTTANWNTTQTVTVTAVNDAANEFSHIGSITHSVTSSDLNYNGFTVDGVLVNITDDDNVAPTVNAGTDQTVYLTGTVWSPTDLNPIAWYDASDAATVTQVSGAVSQWNSKVGTNHMLQATGTKQPVIGGANQINGLNAIAFDGTDDALKTATNPFGASVSNAMIMAVTNIGTMTNSTMFSLTGGSTNRWQAHSPYGNGTMYFDCGGSAGVNRVTGATGWAAGQNKLLGFYSSMTDNVQQVWSNGTMMLGDATGHTVTASSGLALGHDGAASYDNCSMGEVVIINNTVSATNRQKLEGYLAHKWSLQGDLPLDHPYKSQSPSNAAAVANLNGTVSDANGDSLTTTWSVVSGPASVTFGNINAVDTTATFTVIGTYTLRLSASDPGATTNDDVVVTVDNAAGYVVSYNGNGNTSGTAPGNQTKSVGVNLTLATNSGSLAKTGHTYAGWNIAANGTGTNYAEGATYSTDANLALFAKWTPNSYTVTLNNQSGTGGSTSVSATYGLAMPAATAPTRTGYTFGGYYSGTNGTGTQYYTAAMASATNWNLTSATTLYAKWTANNYTVTFDANNGTTPSPTTKVVTFGSTYGTLATTTRTGYTFNGWYTALTGGSLVSTSTNVTTAGNHTLYALWTQVSTYTVTYDGNSNTGGTAPSAQSKTQGIPLTLATNSGNLVRTGYTFAGWNTAIGGNGTDYAAGGSYTLDAAITLYAKWTVATYVISYNANGATSGTAPGDQTKTYNLTLNLASNTGNLARTGYTFAGWNTNASGTGTSYTTGQAYTTNAALNLYAKWTPNTYAVTYNANGATSGSVPADQTKTHDTPLTLQTNTGNLTKTDFNFAGWNTSPDGTGTTYAVGASYTGNTALTLYAKWTPDDYVVTYNANGATSGSAPANQAKVHDAKLTLSGNIGSLAKTGHTFAGWNTAANGTGTDYAEGAFYEVNANLTLFAKWTVNTYTVTYNGNGSTSGTVPVDATTYIDNNLVAVLSPGALTKNPYVFSGWNTAVNGSGNTYYAGNSFAITGNVVLYAQWSPAPVTIYEPFADTDTTLATNAVGTGLSGTWTADAAFTVNSTSLTYGSLPTTGGRVNITGSAGTCSATVGTALATNGLLTDGNTLWFSMIISSPSAAGNNADTGFAIGSGIVGTGPGNAISMANNKQGIGFAINGSQLKAASWNNTKTTATSGSAVSTSSVMLVVGKIDWSSGNDVISLYRPDAAMNLGSVVSTHSAALSQSNFNIVSFGLRSNTFGFDEIRFGSTYEAVIGLGGSNQIDHFEISTITSPQIVGDPITNITITARNATNQTVTSFGGIVNFGGTAGVTGTSDNFVNGVLSNISITPSVAGSNLTFTVNDGAGHTGSAVFSVNSRYTGWTSNAFTNDFTDTSLASNPDGDSLTNLQEFAFGMDPTTSATQPLAFNVGGEVTQAGIPILRYDAAKYHAVFPRRKDHAMAGLTYTVEFSADMQMWESYNTTTGTVLTGAGSSELEAVSIEFPATVPVNGGGAEQAPKFFRVGMVGN